MRDSLGLMAPQPAVVPPLIPVDAFATETAPAAPLAEPSENNNFHYLSDHRHSDPRRTAHHADQQIHNYPANVITTQTNENCSLHNPPQSDAAASSRCATLAAAHGVQSSRRSTRASSSFEQPAGVLCDNSVCGKECDYHRSEFKIPEPSDPCIRTSVDPLPGKYTSAYSTCSGG